MDEEAVDTTTDVAPPATKKKSRAGRPAGPDVMEVVRKLLAGREGKLAQIGPYVYEDTQTEQGFVECTNDLKRNAAVISGKCPDKTGVMSTLASFITVPQATAYRSTPYFYWRKVTADDFKGEVPTDEDSLINNHWEPMVLSAHQVVFSDGVLDLKANKFQTWDEFGHRLYGPKIMMRYEEVFNAQPTEKFKEFEATLQAVLPDRGARSYFQRVMGGILRPHVNIKKGIFIQGASGSRKTTVATAILCAPAGVGGFSIEAIDDLATNRFTQVSLISKWANLSDDPDGKTDKWVGWYKRYTGSSIMRGEFKMVNVRNYPITAKLIVCCNEIPRMGDSSDAVWSRLCVFKFERKGELEEQFNSDSADNNKLQAEYWCDKDTRAAMLKWLLVGLKEALTNPQPAPETVKAWNHEACGEADPVRRLLQESVVKGDADTFVATEQLRSLIFNAGYSLSDVAIANYMRTLFKVESSIGQFKVAGADARQLRGYKGVKLSAEVRV